MSVSRRGFLKFGLGAALAGAVSGLGFNLRPAFAQAKEFKLKWTKQTTSICCYCAVGCGLIVSTSTSDNPLGKGRAFATSIAIILPLCALSSVIYWFRGGLDFGLALPYLAGGLLGGFVGGRVFKKLNMVWLRRAFALLILYGGVKALFF